MEEVAAHWRADEAGSAGVSFAGYPEGYPIVQIVQMRRAERAEAPSAASLGLYEMAGGGSARHSIAPNTVRVSIISGPSAPRRMCIDEAGT